MFRILLLLSALIFPAAAVASTEHANPAQALAKLVLGADSVEIQYYSKSGKDILRFTDLGWGERLAGALENASYRPTPRCRCISYPRIRLFQKNKLVLTLTVHHGEKLRVHAETISGDFQVGPDVGTFITKLANDRKG